MRSGAKAISSEPMAVRAACHTKVGFDVDPPQRAELIIDHLLNGQLKARECRPLTTDARTLEIKTHPESSHIACSLRCNHRPITDAEFRVDCGSSIKPIKRHFIIIGAMKAGTTTLFNILSKHPALCRTWVSVPKVSFPKEINYFHELYRKSDTPLHYDWRFPFDPESHAWTLDASPNYAKWPRSKRVPGRIASLDAEIKLAYIMREPVDRIESNIAHVINEGSEIKNDKQYVRNSRYAMQLDKFMVHFQRDDILLLDFGQLIDDPAATQRQIFDFLRIEHLVAPGEFHNRRRVGFRLNAAQRAKYARAVRADVKRLINLYGFKPAKSWLRDDIKR